jgi:hypothetical protein
VEKKDEKKLMLVLAVLAIVAFYFLVRLPYMRKLPSGVDAHFHLIAASRFEKGHSPKFLEKFAVGDNYAHPPLLHFLLSFIPEQARPQTLFVVGSAADCCVALLTYYLAEKVVPWPYSFIAAILYSIIPAAYLQSVSQSARPLGVLWYNLSIILVAQDNPAMLTLASIAVALTLLSHKMATQTLLFTCLLLSPLLFMADKLFPLALIFGFGLALLLTKGGYIVTLKDHVGYLKYHFRHGSWDKGNKRPGSPKRLFMFLPFFYIPIFGLLLDSQIFCRISLILAWYIAVLIIFFSWLWGDGYRYLACAALPTSILSAQALYAGVNALWIIPALASSAFVIYRNLRTQSHQVWPDFNKIKVSPNSVILVMPSYAGYIVARSLNCKVLWGGGNQESLRFELETLPKIMSNSPNDLISKFHVTHLLLGSKNLSFIKPIQDSFTRTVETNGYVLFSRKKD